MTSAWAVLVVAGLLEVVWSLALQRAEGFARPGWAVLGIGTAGLSLTLLTLALRRLPLGTAYAAWVAIGTVGVAVTGMVLLGESHSPLRLVALALVVVGVAGLHVAE